MNQKNSLGLDSCFKDLEDPLALFTIWLAEAEKKEINDPNALSLATTNSKNEPSVRMVLLKGLSSKGFVFYTNLNSPKSKDLENNPKASMCFHWKSLQRQIRISGSVTQVDNEQADNYFNSRAYESRIGAWASDQSRTLNNRKELEEKIEFYKEKYPNEKNVPRPPYWGGLLIRHRKIEFWQDMPHRIHKREVYEFQGRVWNRFTLNP